MQLFSRLFFFSLLPPCVLSLPFARGAGSFQAQLSPLGLQTRPDSFPPVCFAKSTRLSFRVQAVLCLTAILGWAKSRVIRLGVLCVAFRTHILFLSLFFFSRSSFSLHTLCLPSSGCCCYVEASAGCLSPSLAAELLRLDCQSSNQQAMRLGSGSCPRHEGVFDRFGRRLWLLRCS